MRRVRLALTGDVMLGRGVDQVLAHPGDPRLWERHVDDARTYVELAEARNGPVPQPVSPDWPWGEALPVLRQAGPDARVINVETSVTRSNDVASDKLVHYRMNPANLDGVTVAEPDVCVLGNNHVEDFGRSGLVDTLDALAGAGVSTAGAGRDIDEASRPAAVQLDRGRVLVYSVAFTSAGVPASWAAGAERPGLDFVAIPTSDEAQRLVERVRAARRPGDIVVVSIHWGSNWGYGVDADQIRFAHELVDGGVDLVHGHSSHHPRSVEVYRGKLILYGCGDLINDYEGIGGHEEYRGDLRLLYLVDLDVDATLCRLTLVPLVARRLRLHAADDQDVDWLRATLDQHCRAHGVRIEHGPDGKLAATAVGAAAGR